MSVTSPVIALFLYAWLIDTNGGSLRFISGETDHPHIYYQLIRGVASILLGCVIGRFIQIKSFELKGEWRKILNAVTIVAVIGYLLVIFTPTSYDAYALVYLPVILLSAFTETSILYKIFNHPFWGKLGALSWTIFVTHCVWAYSCPVVLEKIGITNIGLIISITLSVIVVFSIFFSKIEHKIMKLL